METTSGLCVYDTHQHRYTGTGCTTVKPSLNTHAQELQVIVDQQYQYIGLVPTVHLTENALESRIGAGADDVYYPNLVSAEARTALRLRIPDPAQSWHSARTRSRGAHSPPVNVQKEKPVPT